MEPLRSADVRQLNERVVLNLFYDNEKVSQSDIVTLTGLKPSTVLRIFSNLERYGEIYMIDPNTEVFKRSIVGRHPVYYRINPTAHYTIGLTFAKDAIELVIVDFALNIVHSARDAFTFPETAERLADDIAAFVKKAMADFSVEAGTLLGVGVACPGNVDPDRGLLLSLLSAPGVKDYPLKDALEARIGARVFLQGANLLAAQYYNRYGDMEARDRILYVSIGSAVMGSFYTRSPNGMLGGVPSLPVGWMLLQRPDNLVTMRDVRTLNSVCSEESILAATRPLSIMSMRELEEALYERDARLTEIVQSIGDALSYCVSNLSMLFQPQAVILASRSKRFSALLASTISHLLDSRYYWPFEHEPTVIGTTHNVSKISRSAVDLVLDNEFGANLGWKRPKVLSQPQHEEGWRRHVKD